MSREVSMQDCTDTIALGISTASGPIGLKAVDTRTAAKLLGVSKSHLEKLRTMDPTKSPVTISIGRSIRYPLNLLQEWIDKQVERPR